MNEILTHNFLNQDWVKTQPKPFQTQLLAGFEKRLGGEIDYIDYFSQPMIYSHRDSLFYVFEDGKLRSVGSHKSENDLERLSLEAFDSRFDHLGTSLQATFSQKAYIENQLELMLVPEDVEACFFSLVKNFPQEEQAYLVKAFHLAKTKHQGQYRDEGIPYYTHPTFVAIKGMEAGLPAKEIIVLLLHDTLEDTDLTYEEIENEFGDGVATLVLGLSKTLNGKKHISKDDYIARISETEELARAKGFDRLANLYSLNFASDEKKKKYLIETKEVILPIVAQYDPRLAQEINQVMDYIENEDFELPEALKLKVQDAQKIVLIKQEIQKPLES